jgi:hypothetical protein
MKLATSEPVTDRRGTGASGPGLRELEGLQVNLALADGSRLDAVTLVSAGRGRTPTVWVYAGGIDVFVPRSHVIDAWESPPPVRAA